MNPTRPPILLTSSVVVHDTNVALSDAKERTLLALKSVQEWLRIDPGLRIVLCDGSGFDFSELVAERFPQADIECLPFHNDAKLVRRFGRGYGEGEIVRHAINHSRLIAHAGCFAKCTSKLWVENFAECLKHWNGDMGFKGVFLDVFSPRKKTTFAYIDTRFYLVSCESYRRYFENAHLNIRTDQGHGLEECFRDVVRERTLSNILLTIPPVIAGVGGGTGMSYRNSLKRRLKEKLRLQLVRLSQDHAHLF